MPSAQARFFNALVRLMVRRRYWGDEVHLAGRARRLFGAPPLYPRLLTRSLRLTQVATDGIRAEWLSIQRPEPGVVFYVHGGGFVACSKETHRPVTAGLAKLTRRKVLSVNYRLAPEHRYPAAIDDVTRAYLWLLKTGVEPSRVAIAGDSAGGNLVVSLAIRLRNLGHPLPACIVAFSPWTDLFAASPSVTANDGKCAMFRPENMDQFARAYLGRAADNSPEVSPLYADLSGLPPLLLHVGSTELLLDDSRLMHERILAAGGESELQVFDDVSHGWQMLSPIVPEGTRSLEQAAAFIERYI